ncbi:MAG: TlpA family protein disulfide reductase [Clostridia bacterium]|nr:TlpA family protein disulfide reductase [Clostridia bacterium]
MKKYLKWAGILLGIGLFFLGANFLYQYLSEQYDPQNIVVEENAAEMEAESSTAENAPMDAPDFTVEDLDGNPVNLSDFKGKPVVLNFWASWCPPCKSEMPDFDDVYAQVGEDVHFMMVNLTDGDRETVATASAYVESQGYSFPVYYDTAMQAAIAYQVMSVPTTYFIDADGRLIARASGAIDAETLERGIGMIRE